MNNTRRFSLAEAKLLLPQLKSMLDDANIELNNRALAMAEAGEDYTRAEEALASFKDEASASNSIAELRSVRQVFQDAINQLTTRQKDYNECLSNWVDKISDTGVILRDIESGLLDFPARKGKVDYFLCWCRNEDEIEHWHLINDGYMGRRPLSVLAEYF